MTEMIEICAVCAWRATCQKKFSLSGRNMRCPDFVRDFALREKAEQAEKEEEGRR